MRRTYSLYEAKARLSEIVRRVRERRESVIVSYHGEPVAEICPIEPAVDAGSALQQRLRVLYARGAVSAPA